MIALPTRELLAVSPILTVLRRVAVCDPPQELADLAAAEAAVTAYVGHYAWDCRHTRRVTGRRRGKQAKREGKARGGRALVVARCRGSIPEGKIGERHT